MSKVLLINPSYSGTYGSTKVGVTNPIMPTLGLATIAAVALERRHQVNILDLSHQVYDWSFVRDRITELKPDVVGITATTPLMNQLRDISVLCKDISRDILVVGGGSHVSALPRESMAESMIDIAVVGEGEYSFADICDGKPPVSIRGLYYRGGGENVCYSGDRLPINNLDDLPMPAWHLYDPAEYRNKISRLLARCPPVTMAEFSRGCVYKCDFCASKITMALGYRKKSPARCAEEVKAMHRLGWREFMLADDIFSSDNRWATAVCEAICRSGVKIAWSCTNGIRVESADWKLFDTMRRAGCYRVSFGFESGDDAVLRAFGKGGRATIDKGRDAVKLARRAGMDANGYFLLGLSADTEASMMKTIAYARSLELDMLKFGITVALPGTPMFQDFAKRKLIRTYDWDQYYAYSGEQLFAHPHLEFKTIEQFMRVAYRRTIMTNPGFIFRRLRRGIKTGEFFWDAYYFMKFLCASAVNRSEMSRGYYAPDRWPRHDYLARPPDAVATPRVTAKETPPTTFHVQAR
jgi:anaerobic magnesium-protoporphyrin IX monomethyl ester cyclase